VRLLSELDLQNKAKWGFLKNIVNIDRFFASGPEPAHGAVVQTSENVQLTKEHSKAKKVAKSKKSSSLAQLKSKQKESEDTIEAAGETDDQTHAQVETVDQQDQTVTSVE